MKQYAVIAWMAGLFVFFQSCTGTRRFGTTIERDENNPCQVNIVVQIGIQGTDADVAKVKSELDGCYNKECFIPCDNDKEKGCKTKVTTVVRKWSSLKEDEQNGFHYVNMIDNDGLPSNAFIGKPNTVTPEGSSTWRRDEPPGTYCHEVLHLCGLRDKYCSRLYDPVTTTVTVEKTCDPPPDPGFGNQCCSPSADLTRCGTPCAGHENDLLASTSAALSCENIIDIVKGAGLDKCPQECCSSNMTFTRPAEVNVTPGYLHFGDKNTKFGSIGVSVGYTKYFNSSLGATVDAGYYTHTDKDNNVKQTSGLLNATAGVIYLPGKQANNDITVSTHGMIGISRYTQKSVYNNNSYRISNYSVNFNIGAALNWKLNKSFNIRILQADYTPTFFYDAIQQNIRISTGLAYKIPRRN